LSIKSPSSVYENISQTKDGILPAVPPLFPPTLALYSS